MHRWLLILPIVLISCTAFPEAPRSNLSATPGKGYVFGDFHIRLDLAEATIVFQLQNMDTGEVRQLPMYAGQSSVYPVEVPPGNYQLLDHYRFFIGALELQNARINRDLPPLKRPFTVRANELVYIGTIRAEYSLEKSAGMVEQRIDLKQFSMDQARAYQKLALFYPAMNGLQARPAWENL